MGKLQFEKALKEGLRAESGERMRQEEAGAMGGGVSREETCNSRRGRKKGRIGMRKFDKEYI